MTPAACQQGAVAAVERASRKPVVLTADAKLATEAVMRIAGDSAVAHVLTYRTSSEGELPYLVCFQCGMALRAVLAPRDERFNVASSGATYATVRQLVDMRNPAWRGSLPEDAVAGYSRMITDGLGTQLRSVPVGMRVDGQIHADQPSLRAMQRAVVERQLQENAAILNPSVRQNAPELLFNASAAMNAAYAVFWSRLWEEDSPLVPYRLSGFVNSGEKLVALLDSVSDDRMHDRELVAAWAKALGIDTLFVVGPVGL